MTNKKMMKKTAGILTCLALAAAMPTAAFAAGSGSLSGDQKQQDIDVNVTYQDASTTPDVYSVDLEWEDMTFTYNAAGTKVWNPDTHTYTENTTGSWVKDSAEITVTNHSNKGIAVNAAYQNDNEIGVDAAITNGTFTIESAVDKAVDAPELTKKATLTISGTPTDQDAQDMKVGTVKVTIV